MSTIGDSLRESRRRRIVERGADRLALITGRRQTLNSLSPATSSTPDVLHSTENKASSFEFAHHDSPAESDKIDTNDGESRFMSPHNEFSAASNIFNTNDVESKAEPLLSKFETSRDTSRASDKERNVQRVESRIRCGKLFTPKQINSAIAATESTRIYCSVAVAVLVSLSYIGFPILANSITKSIIYYKPLYLVLITEISIVLKRLLFDGRGVQRPERDISETPLIGGVGSAEQLAKVLELGLCFKNITNAVFVDLSVYAIVLVCILAFAQKLG